MIDPSIRNNFIVVSRDFMDTQYREVWLRSVKTLRLVNVQQKWGSKYPHSFDHYLSSTSGPINVVRM